MLPVVTLEDVAATVSELPEVHEGERYGQRTWLVGKKGFAWERPLTKADVKRFGEAGVVPPAGPIVAVATEDLAEKEAVLEEGLAGVFTMSHFDGYPALLIQLDRVHKRVLRRLVTDAWLACAPDALARGFLARR